MSLILPSAVVAERRAERGADAQGLEAEIRMADARWRGQDADRRAEAKVDEERKRLGLPPLSDETPTVAA